MWKPERILVGLDLTSKGKSLALGSQKALGQARWVARQAQASLTLFHSTRTDAWAEAVAAGEVHGAQPLTSAGKEILEGYLEEIAAEGIPCDLDLGSDRPWLDMTRRAVEGRCDLVVIGKRDVEERDGRRLGSVATKLLRKCPAPVWAVEPGHDLSLKLILAATDLTAVGDRNVQLGAQIAAWQGGSLHVVHAYRIPLVLQAQVDHISPEEYEAKLETIRKAAQEQISWVASSAGFDAPLDLHIGRNSAFNGIKEAAEHLHPDLLVMGTLSHCNNSGILVGDTAEKLIGRMHSSLLMLKPREFISPIDGQQIEG